MRIALPASLAAVLTAVLCVSSPLQAQPAQSPATRLQGIIERIDGANMTVKTAQGSRAVTLTSDVAVFAMVNATLADIKPGAFVGVGAKPQPDGSQQAIRVVIFPESLRGLGEGHRPWDRPGTTMTNATVDTAVTRVDGQVIKVRYKGGEKNIVVGPDAAILTYVASSKSELKPGASVTISGTAKNGGPIEANRVTVARSGVLP
jgi:hypothetical protein